MGKYIFEYSEYMRKYREKNKISSGVAKVELKDKNQLKNKKPKFKITYDFLVYEGLPNEHFHEEVVKTTPLENGSYIVDGGWGQISLGRIIKL